MKEIEELRLLCREVLGHGGISSIEKQFKFTFREWRRSPIGPSLRTVLEILATLDTSPGQFFEDSEFRRAELPRWWSAFDRERFENPQNALSLIEEDCPWRNYAIGLVAFQWGQYSEAIKQNQSTPDTLRKCRLFSLAYINKNANRALAYSDKAASIAAFSNQGDLNHIRLERATILHTLDIDRNLIFQILDLVLSETSDPKILATAWQQMASNLADIGQTSQARKCLSKARRTGFLPRQLRGHLSWTEGRLLQEAGILETALSDFGFFFPRETALLTLDLIKVRPASQGIAYALYALREQKHYHLAAIVENAMADHQYKASEHIARIWRRRSNRLLQRALR